MKKYIDYNSLEQEAYEMLCHARQQVDLIIANTIKSMIDKQPDALVRCKDCKYCFVEGFVHEHNICDKHEWIQGQPDDWYCADAKRR